jgi:hypothetical protein
MTTAAPRRLATGGILLGLVGLIAVLDPHDAGRYPVYPTCPWHALTGTWCPGCGGLRAVHDITHGHIGAAAGENLLVVLLVPALTVWWLVVRRRTGQVAPPRLTARATVLVTLVALAFAVVRNLPVGSALAP